MILNFTIDNQRLRCRATDVYVEGSLGYLDAEFAVSEDWNDKVITVFFQHSTDSAPYAVILDDNLSCRIPSSVLKAGQVEVWVRGDHAETMVTTSTIYFVVYATGSVAIVDPDEQDVYSQVVEMMTAAKNDADAAKNSAEASENYAEEVASSTLNAAHYADMASGSATNAAASEASAAESEANALVYKNAAAQSTLEAQGSAGYAQSYATDALESMNTAAEHEENALQSREKASDILDEVKANATSVESNLAATVESQLAAKQSSDAAKANATKTAQDKAVISQMTDTVTTNARNALMFKEASQKAQQLAQEAQVLAQQAKNDTYFARDITLTAKDCAVEASNELQEFWDGTTVLWVAPPLAHLNDALIINTPTLSEL